MNASEMKRAIDSRVLCEGLDQWISTSLKDAFFKSIDEYKVRVNAQDIRDNGWEHSDFMRAMEKRGYKVEYSFTGGSFKGWYEYHISIPS